MFGPRLDRAVLVPVWGVRLILHMHCLGRAILVPFLCVRLIWCCLDPTVFCVGAGLGVWLIFALPGARCFGAGFGHAARFVLSGARRFGAFLGGARLLGPDQAHPRCYDVQLLGECYPLPQQPVHWRIALEAAASYTGKDSAFVGAHWHALTHLST